jgi:CheY-like chemotaxis protein
MLNQRDDQARLESQAAASEDLRAGRILVVAEDLFFLAKIRETARQLAVELEVSRPDEVVAKLAGLTYTLLILDLNHRSGRAIETLKAVKTNPQGQGIRVLGFLSHVQGDLAAAARDAGCDVIMARSAFSARLPAVLVEYGSSAAR